MILRSLIGTLTGFLCGVLVAALWTRPNDFFAGLVCGFLFTFAGHFAGTMWGAASENRK